MSGWSWHEICGPSSASTGAHGNNTPAWSPTPMLVLKVSNSNACDFRQYAAHPCGLAFEWTGSTTSNRDEELHETIPIDLLLLLLLGACRASKHLRRLCKLKCLAGFIRIFPLICCCCCCWARARRQSTGDKMYFSPLAHPGIQGYWHGHATRHDGGAKFQRARYKYAETELASRLCVSRTAQLPLGSRRICPPTE